jgi:hypothetical protein
MNQSSQTPFDAIRQMAANIIQKSGDVITIELQVMGGDLKAQIQIYKESRKGNALSALSLSPENEIGLIMFYNTINFCYRDPDTRRDYEFQSHDGRILSGTAAMLTAMVLSGMNWNVLEKVSAITAEQWQHMFQLKSPNVLYLGMQRRERVTGLATYFQSQGYQTVMDFLEASQFNVVKLTMALKKQRILRG